MDVDSLTELLAEHKWLWTDGCCSCGWKWTKESALDVHGYERHIAIAISVNVTR